MENLLSKEEMEAIINGDHSNPFSVLGIHKNKGSKDVLSGPISQIPVRWNFLIITVRHWG